MRHIISGRFYRPEQTNLVISCFSWSYSRDYCGLLHLVKIIREISLMTMLLFVFLAFCLSGFAASSKYNDVQFAVSVEPDFVEDEPCGCYKDPVPQCGCCGKFEFDGKHHSVCMNMTRVKEKHGLRLTIVSDDKVLLDKTISVKHPPPYCQGICSTGCICENYYNMSFGDDGKWGGCLQIYGDLKIHAFDIDFGCYYLPVNQAEQKPIVDEPYQSVLFNDIQQWYRNTLTKKMRDRRLKKKNLLYFLYENRVEKDNLK